MNQFRAMLNVAGGKISIPKRNDAPPWSYIMLMSALQKKIMEIKTWWTVGQITESNYSVLVFPLYTKTQLRPTKKKNPFLSGE
jgi:hypothetical protein